MSVIAWKTVLLPEEGVPERTRDYTVYQPPLKVENTRAFAADNRRLAELPDRRAARALSRTGLLLVKVGLRAEAPLAVHLRDDPFKVGIYAALEASGEDYAACRAMAVCPPESFAAAFKRHMNPRYYLRSLANIPPAQLAIFLGVRGPVRAFKHSRHAAVQALNAAETDLYAGGVTAALVCAAFSLEDALLAARARADLPKHTVLCEGAGALLLTAGGQRTSWQPRSADAATAYGIAHDIIVYAS